MSSLNFNSYMKKIKQYEKTHISEYMYLSRYNIDMFHKNIETIVSHAKDILETPEDEWKINVIDNLIKEFIRTLSPIKQFYCVDLTHRLYEHIDATTRKHFEQLFELMDNIESAEMRNALDNIIEIDKIFGLLYHDEINDITNKMKKIKIKKTIKKVSHKEMDDLVGKMTKIQIKK
jgi:hypothetical protein